MLTNVRSRVPFIWVLACLPLFAADLFASSVDSTASAKPKVYWFWLFNGAGKAGITRDRKRFRGKGIAGANLIDNGAYADARREGSKEHDFKVEVA